MGGHARGRSGGRCGCFYQLYNAPEAAVGLGEDDDRILLQAALHKLLLRGKEQWVSTGKRCVALRKLLLKGQARTARRQACERRERHARQGIQRCSLSTPLLKGTQQ